MPLDIKDEDLVLDQGSLLETIKTTVDENGWNIENGFFSGTVIRARYQLALVREQIAEIALGHDCRETVDHLLYV